MTAAERRWQRSFWVWVAEGRHARGCGATAWRALFLAVWGD